MQDDDVYLAPKQLARRWNKSERTLERWRHEGRGPAWTMIGGTARYRLGDIKAYENAGKHDPANRGWANL